jgi:hypothetical protein
MNNPRKIISDDTIHKYGGVGPWIFLHIYPFSMSPAFLANYEQKMQWVMKGGWRKLGKIINGQRYSAISSKVQQRCFIRYISVRYVLLYFLSNLFWYWMY